MSALAVVQARMSSRRLPGKSLADVAGEPMLSLVVNRLRHATRLRRIVVATSTDPGDDAIAATAAELGFDAVRGPLDDVLARFVEAIGDHPGAVVRITADCPLTDPDVVDAAIALYEATPGCRYVCNTVPRTFPKGLDVEVVAADALRAIASERLDPDEREHVTVAIRSDAGRFPAAYLTQERDEGELRWTVDTADDLEFVRQVVERLGDRRHLARRDEILEAIRATPSLAGFRGKRG